MHIRWNKFVNMLLQQASATLGALETLLQFDCLEYDRKEQPFTTPHYMAFL